MDEAKWEPAGVVLEVRRRWNGAVVDKERGGRETTKNVVWMPRVDVPVGVSKGLVIVIE